MERGEDFLHLPPGFGFHPSDEELIVHYLFNKVKLGSIPASVIAEIELYKYNPWDLPGKASFGKDEWYFFSPRDRKYPKGSRPKRSAGSGFWKATGKDKQIYTSSGSKIIGVKKALAFFSGNPTKCYKTNWTMSEYRLPESSTQSTRLNRSMRLDDWVLCRIRQKGNKSKNLSQVQENPKNKLSEVHFPTIEQELPSSYMVTKSSMDIISDRRSIEFQLMASILAGQDLSPIIERCSPRLLQGDNNGLVDEGAFYKESAPVMLDGDTVEHNEVFSRDVWASNDPFNVLAENHKDGSII